MASLMKGVNGASSCATVVSVVCSVWYAALLVRVRLRFPKRLRDLRMYHFDRRRPNAAIGRAGTGHVVVGQLRVHCLDQAGEPRQ